MKAPPLLSEHPAPVRFGLAVVLPAAFGAVTGIFLGVSEPVYIVLSLLGILGGLGAGFDHVGARQGARRGVLAGLLFGAFILIAHEIHGEPAEAHLPEPAVILVIITTFLGAAFGATGGRLRARSLSREPAVETPAEDVAAVVEDAGTERAIAPPAAAVASERATPSVSLNSAGFEDYRSIGMTITQAKRIVDYRDRLGGFKSVDQLDDVPGFSMANLAEMKPRLTV